MIKFKSVNDPVEMDDGIRILAARFRGRGMKSDRYDVWMPSLGPSEKLLKDMLEDRVSWAEFRKKYRDEVLSSAAIDRNNATILNHGQKFTFRLIKMLGGRGQVTLMCHCDTDEQHCHLRVMEKIIQSL
ncbi:MAG TPA: DUF488 family protein [Spirochaetota bacterium]|jgi:uncharacterized protein YeaO (DUF488 family)|nr:DUF488 family protein [Spirochaetota bacterium]HPV42991.1 DUF488 family protein [Spirochaetota bacterium]